MFKFELGQKVKITISGEVGEIKGRAQYTESSNQYFILYKAVDDRAVESWFSEGDLSPVDPVSA